MQDNTHPDEPTQQTYDITFEFNQFTKIYLFAHKDALKRPLNNLRKQKITFYCVFLYLVIYLFLSVFLVLFFWWRGGILCRVESPEKLLNESFRAKAIVTYKSYTFSCKFKSSG